MYISGSFSSDLDFELVMKHTSNCLLSFF